MIEFQYDECSTCGGLCCMATHLLISKDELQRIANYLETSIEEIMRWCRVRGPYPTHRLIVPRPCPFLQYGLCGIYEVRPDACRLYKPYTRSNGQTCREYHMMVWNSGWTKDGR